MRVYRVVPVDAANLVRASDSFLYVARPSEPCLFVSPDLNMVQQWHRLCYGSFDWPARYVELEVDFVYAWHEDFDDWCDEHRVNRLDYQQPGTQLVRTITDRRDWPVHSQPEALAPLHAIRWARPLDRKELAHEPSSRRLRNLLS